MQSTTHTALQRPVISPTRLLSAPLPDLLAELGVDLVESPISDASFFGAVVVRRDGRIALSMPPGRPDWERSAIARSLLGNVLGVDLEPLPDPLCAEVAHA